MGNTWYMNVYIFCTNFFLIWWQLLSILLVNERLLFYSIQLKMGLAESV